MAVKVEASKLSGAAKSRVISAMPPASALLSRHRRIVRSDTPKRLPRHMRLSPPLAR